MKEMDLFDEKASGFQEAYQQFVNELNIGRTYVKYNGLDSYFQGLYEKGELQHNELLDELIRKCYFCGREEYDIAFSAMQALKYCLSNGFTYEEVRNLNREALEAIDELHKLDSNVNTKLEVLLAAILFDRKCDYHGRLLRALTNVGSRQRASYGIALFDFKSIVAPVQDIMQDIITSGEYNCLDVYNIACLLNEGKSLQEAMVLYERFKGKGYTYEAMRIVTECFKGSDVPSCTNTLELMLQYEIQTKPVMDINMLLKFSEALEKHQVSLKQFYRAGFTISYMSLDFGDDTFKKLLQILFYLEAVNNCVRYNKKLSEELIVNGRTNQFLTADFVFECIRSIYFEDVDTYDLDMSDLSSGNVHSRVINKWLLNLTPVVKFVEPMADVKWKVYNQYDEVQIICDKGVMFHFPVDFFTEYQNEFSKWVKTYQPEWCSVKLYDNTTTKSGGTGTLCIVLSKQNNISVTLRNNPVNITVDLATKKELIFGQGSRVTCPILKSMLYQYFKKNDKDTGILDSLDLQTVLAFIQVLIMQNSEDYQVLFKRQDSFSTGFQKLRWFVRADDNFYSAVLRYIMVVAGIRTQYNANAISKSLHESVVVNGQEMNILSIFSGDKSLLEVLQSNHDTLRPYLKEDVMYFE